MLPLINRTSQSFGRSMMQATDIVAHAKKHNLPVAALTDVHSLSALPDFLLKCYESGIHGIAGLTLQITENQKVVGDMVLLAKGGSGFAALRDLLDIGGYVGNHERYTPEMGLPLDRLLSGAFADKLKSCIMLDGFPGSIGDALLKKDGGAKDIVGASALLQDPNSRISRLRAQFGDGDYLGVHTPGSKNPLASVLSIPSKSGVEEVPRVLESTLGYAKDQAQSWQTMAWFKSYAQEYLDGLGMGDRINDMIRQKYQHATLDAAPTYGPGEPPFLGARYLIERCPTPRIFKTQQESLPLNWARETPSLRNAVEQAWVDFSQTLPESDRPLYRARVDEELSTIQSCHFEDYFVNILKIKQIAKEDGNALMLRGSAVSSLVMHMLDMTPIDPIKERLLFARFISSGRVEDPDVDIEFVNPSGVTRAIESACLPGQMAKLSSDKGISNPTQLLALAKDALLNFYTLSDEQKKQVEADYEYLMAPIRPKAKPAGNAPAKRWDKAPLWHKSMNKWLERFWNRQTQNQRAGMRTVLVGIAQNYNVPAISSNLSPNSVVFVPDGVRRYFNVLSPYKNERVEGEVGRITQTKHNLSATGHIKYDLLSNRSFTRAMNQMDSLGLPKTMKMDPNDPSIPFVFHNDAFMGVNQVSGFVGATQARMFLPKNFNELTAINALIRDGALVSQGAVDQYLRAKNAPEGVQLDTLLQPILGETYGCLLYEEQLLRLLTEVGGFEWKMADKFRSSLKKGKFDIIDQYESSFIQQAVSLHGVDQQTASRWYQPLREKRGRFVFNKAHAVAYAHLAVQQCWLKTHYPANYAAEMVLDPKAQFIDETITADLALKDWAKLYPQGGPQQAQDFIKAIGTILVREEKNPDSGYRRDLGSVQRLVSNAIESGSLDFALPPGVDRARALGLCSKMFAKLSERGYAPIKHDAIRDGNRPQSGQKQHGDADPSVPKGGAAAPTIIDNGVPPANRREGYVEWNNVMISHLLMFFREAGVITNLSVEYNTSELDRFRFNVTEKDGKIHQFHLVCPTADVSRNHAGKRKINSGMHQDRTDPTDTLVLAAEISNLVNVPGLPKSKLITRERGGLTFEKEDWLKFRASFGAYCRKSPHALHDIVSGGIASLDMVSSGLFRTNVPKMPTPPVMTDLQPAQMESGYKKAREFFEQGRHVHFDGLYNQFEHGHISVAQVRSDKPNERKNGARSVYLSVLANYIEVTSTTPLYQSPLIRDNCLSPGGHQQFMSEKVDAKKNEIALKEEREKGLPYKPKIHLTEKVGKIDLGTTTSAVRALVHGHITPGSQTLWLTEAALDAWSFNELQRELRQLNQISPVPFAEENAISVKSAGFATRLFEEMLSISVINKKDGSPLDFCQVQSKKIAKPFADADAKNLADWFKKQTLHFMRDDRPENLEASQRLQSLLSTIGLKDDEIKNIVKVHQSSPSRTFSQNVNTIFDKFVIGANSGFVHQSNLDTWLRSAGLAVLKQDDGTYLSGRATFDVQRGRAFSTFSPEEQQKVRRALVAKFQHMTGAQSIGLALDNDLKADGKPGAGLDDALQVKSICEMLAIPVAELMPMERPDVVLTIQGRPMRFDLKDHNDYLTAFKALRGAGQEQDAQQLLREYASYLKQPQINSPVLQVAPQQVSPVHKPAGQ